MMISRRYLICALVTGALLSGTSHRPLGASTPVVVSLSGSGPVGWDNGLFAGEGVAAPDAVWNAPTGLARAADGSLLVADYWNNRIRAIDPTGVVSTVAGNGWPGNQVAANAMNSPLWGPWGVTMRGTTVVFSDTFNSAIRAVLPDGSLVRLAGTMSGTPGSTSDPYGGWSGFSGDNGPAASARLDWPLGLCTDGAGDIYVADSWNNRIRKITPDGTITTVAGDGFSDAWGRGRFHGDGGPATAASLNWPTGVAVDGSGNLYIADTYNQRIRRVDAQTHAITTVAGNGEVGSVGDNLPATEARLNHPCGVALASNGTLYIADTMNHRIRAVVNGTIVPVAGDGYRGLSGDNGPADAARFNEPQALCFTANGDLVVADTGNNRIRMILFGDTSPVSGTVRDATTRLPLPGARVAWSGLQATADATGAYTLRVRQGAQTVVASFPTYGTMADSVEVGADPVAHDFLLPSGFVNVRVADDGGHIVPNALVTTHDNQGATGPDGTVLLRLPPGAQALSAACDGYAPAKPASVTIVAGETVSARLTLPRTGSVPLSLPYSADWISGHANPGDYTTPSGDYAFPSEELPAANSIVSVSTPTGTVDFAFPDTSDGALNALHAEGQTLAIPAGRYAAVHLLESSQFGSFDGNLTLKYADGGSTTVATHWSDWAWNAIGQSLGPNETVAFPCSHRHQAGNPGAAPPVDILHLGLPVDDTRTLTGIVLPADANGTGSQDPYIFAISLDAIGGPAYGDVDASGSVAVPDATLCLRVAAGLGTLDPAATRRGDVYPVAGDGTFGDGQVTMGDALSILRSLGH